MNFTLANSIILAGVIQGFIFGLIYLLSEKYRSKTTMFLALLIIVFSYNNLQFYISDAKIISGNVMYATLYIPVGSLIPVLIYKYISSFLNEKTSTSKLKRYLLYAPFIIFFGLAIILKIDAVDDIAAVRKPVWQITGKIQSIFSLLFTLILISISYWKVHKHTFLEKDEAYLYKPELKWLQYMLICLFLLSLLWAFALYKYVANVEFRIYFTTLWIALSIAIYWLGHIGIYKYGIRKERKSIRAKTANTTKYSISEPSKSNYPEKIEQIIIGQKEYLNATFSAEILADTLQISKSHLSRIFNSDLNCSFSDYINTARVEEAKKHLKNPEFSNYTLVAIGLEAGFNSKTTFNTTFKKMTGQTPSQFRKNAIK